MKSMSGVAEQQAGMKAGNRHADGGVRSQQHVDDLGARGWIEHRRNGIDVDDAPVDEVESGRRIHPGICRDHECRGHRAGDRHHHPGEHVDRRADAFPAVQIHPKKNGFEKEGETLERKGHPDDRPGERHEPRPQQTELEREHRSGHRADREQNRAPSCPEFGKLEVFRTLRAAPGDLGGQHHDRHRHPDDGKDDVECERQAHLPARIEDVHRRSALLSPQRG